MQMITAEDCSTIGRFQRGDKSAFDELIRRHGRRARQYAFQLTKNSEEADDVVSSTFIRIFRSLDGFKGESSFTTWMYRIETNCFLDMRKKARSIRLVRIDEGSQNGDGQVTMQIPDLRENAQEYLERRERMSWVGKAMFSLPKRQREILLMYQTDLMSYEDIADVLDLPLGTVKSRINRARLNLRELLNPCKGLFMPISRKPRAPGREQVSSGNYH